MVSNKDDLTFEFLPFVKAYKNGHVERLMFTDSVPAGYDAETGVFSKDVNDIIPETEVYVRIYLPEFRNNDQKFPLVVYFHGGGFFVCAPSTAHYQDYHNVLVAESQVIVVSVHYRRAPEHPVPVAYEDSWAALQWVASHVDRNGPEALLNKHADFERVFLVGDSAGGNIVHNMAMSAGKADAGLKMEIHGVALVDPLFWGSEPIGSETLNPNGKEELDRFWPLAFPSSLSNDDPRINPMAKDAPSLAGLGCRRVLVTASENDILKDRGWLYYETLKGSGWKGEVEILETKGKEHCFHFFDLKGEKGKERMGKLVNFLKKDI